MAFCSHVQIRFAGLLCFLLKAVKHVNHIGKLGDVDHSERTGLVSNPDFLNSLPTVAIGFQSVGACPFCTLSSW